MTLNHTYYSKKTVFDLLETDDDQNLTSYGRLPVFDLSWDVNYWNMAAGPEANIDGTPGDDTLVGTPNNDTIRGFGGNDTLSGLGANDVLEGGDGNDTLFGGIGNDRLEGGADDDVLEAGDGNDLVLAGDGNDTIIAGPGDDAAFGAFGEDGDDVFIARDDMGTLNFFSGGAGFDTIDARQLTVGTDGEYAFVFSFSSSDFEQYLGGDARDVVQGNYTNDNIYHMGGGDDFIGASDGADLNDGGTGSDRVSYFGSTAVNVNLATGAASGGWATGDTFISIENLSGSDFDDILTGDAGDNFLAGNGGADQLNGGAGNDTLYGNEAGGTNPGSDVLNGGTGFDTASYAFDLGPVTLNLSNTALNTGSAAGDSYISIEAYEGSNGDDDMTGTNAANVLFGAFGNDIIRGLGGNDTLSGDAGDDTLEGGNGVDLLIGGVGADSLDGGTGIDTADYSSSSGRVVVNLNNGTGTQNDADGDTLTNIENVIGSDFNDLLIGNGAVNVLMGGAASDDLRGGGGNDILEGGVGADNLNGQGAFDTASYAGSSARVVINLINGVANQGDATGDTLVSIENLLGSDFNDIFNGSHTRNTINGGLGNDYVSGRGGSDMLFGGDGNDNLLGGGARDFLTGGNGDDALNGGTARDVFIFADGFGTDTIEDFEDNRDDIDFSGNSSFNSIADVLAAATQMGADVHIVDGTNTLILENFNVADLGPGDFIF